GGGLADHLELAVALEGVPQAAADQVVIVDEQHFGARRRRRRSRHSRCSLPLVPDTLPSPRCGSEHNRHCRTTRNSWRDLQPASDTFRPLRHDRKAVVTVGALVTDAAAIIRDFYLCERRIDRARYPKIFRTGVFPCVC